MLTENEQAQENSKMMAEMQKDYALIQFKCESKKIALNSAINLRPYVNGTGLVSTPDPEFNVIAKADEIYKWLLEI